MSRYLRIKVELSLDDYLAGIIELVRQGLLKPTPSAPIRIAGGYFRKRAPHLLQGLPEGFVVEDQEVILPRGYQGDIRRNAPSQIIIDRRLLGAASNDLAWGESSGQTVCWLSAYDSGRRRANQICGIVEKAGLLMKTVAKARTQGFMPVEFDIEQGRVKLSGPGGLIVIQAGEEGQTEVWGENFYPVHACHGPIEAIAAQVRSEGAEVLEHRDHTVWAEQMKRR